MSATKYWPTRLSANVRRPGPDARFGAAARRIEGEGGAGVANHFFVWDGDRVRRGRTALRSGNASARRHGVLPTVRRQSRRRPIRGRHSCRLDDPLRRRPLDAVVPMPTSRGGRHGSEASCPVVPECSPGVRSHAHADRQFGKPTTEDGSARRSNRDSLSKRRVTSGIGPARWRRHKCLLPTFRSADSKLRTDPSAPTVDARVSAESRIVMPASGVPIEPRADPGEASVRPRVRADRTPRKGRE